MDKQSVLEHRKLSESFVVKREEEKDEHGSVKLFCQPCHYVDSTNKNECNGFCIECTEYLCSECIRDHRKNKTTRQHAILHEKEIP
ncbi:hypothetical protein DPMN_165815 [Dreissena polymorpha]|uniref:B box-type domain-containing protein n=1 Tax=Dreissena polymorpha TaxID=45954 RepID=A0A9D4EXH7_DREPO|nr:hypothetical protein DPMN_165815 [Dreissena polymorpha]